MLQWQAEDDTVLWTSRFPDDAYPPAVHAVIHLELGEKGEGRATGSLTTLDAVGLPRSALCRVSWGDGGEGIAFPRTRAAQSALDLKRELQRRGR
jgi:hypothetical protein